jgi:transposase InsO family protein
MRLTTQEKEEIIRLVDRSELGVNKTLRQLGIHKSTFYNWYSAHLKKETAGLLPVQKTRQQWNTIPQEQRQVVVELALDHPALSPRELAVKITDEQQIFISESSVYRILKAQGLITTPAHILLSAAKEFKQKTCFVHEMWQTDFTYFKVVGWGWYYLSTILDDYSRFIVHWELCKTMAAEDVERCIGEAMTKAHLGAEQRPRLLSDNGSCYIAQDLKAYLKRVGVRHIHGRAQHPQTQGKIERYHRSMKNVVKLEHYYCPEELTAALSRFVHYYNHERYHESLDNVTPADVYLGKREQILKKREKIKQQTLKQRRQRHLIRKQII